MRRLLPLAILLPVLACGGPGVDGKKLQSTMPAFVTLHENAYGSLDLPLYDDDRNVLLGFVPPGKDPVALCDALASFVGARDHDVRVDVLNALGGPVRASGDAGERCSAE